MADAPRLSHLDLPLEAIRAFCERHRIRRLGVVFRYAGCSR
jgi:hypothetical protein